MTEENALVPVETNKAPITETRIVPIMVKANGELAIQMERQDSKKMGFTKIETEIPQTNDGLADTILENLPEGLLSGAENVRLGGLFNTNDGVRYVVVAGSEAAFAPRVKERERWIPQTDFAFGPLPENAPDVHDLRRIYTGSMAVGDHAAVLMGVQEVRSMRHPDFKPIIGSEVFPLGLAVQRPESVTITTEAEIDRGLPPLHLPPGLFAKSNQPLKGMTRRHLFKLAKMATAVATKLPLLPKGTLEAIAQRLQLSGAQPKPL